MHKPEKPERIYIHKLSAHLQEQSFPMEELFVEKETLYFSMQKVSVTGK